MRAKDIGASLLANTGNRDLESKWASLKKTQDPYAFYAIFGDQEDAELLGFVESVSAVPRQHQVAGLSKKDFQNACRRIFRQYVPRTEGQVFRPQYRDFIVRNEQRSPEERACLVLALSKYDLSTSGNFKPHFNREQELLTVAKLQEIEKAALKPSAPK